MSLGDQNQRRRIQSSTYPFENVNSKDKEELGIRKRINTTVKSTH